jgi:hypothetical protein
MREYLIDALVLGPEGTKRTRRHYVVAPHAIAAKDAVRRMADVVSWRHMFVRDADGDYRQMF